MEKLLIVGVDEIAGGNLALALRERFEVVGLHAPGSDVDLEGCRTQSWHPADLDELGAIVADVRPQWAIYSGPLSRSSWHLETDPTSGEREADIALALAGATGQIGCAWTVLTTDAVFTGPRLFHAESDPAEASSMAAQAARHLEDTLTATTAMVVRTHAYGFSPLQDRPGFAESILQALEAGDQCEVDPVRHASPILVHDLAEALHRAYRANLRGLYHITGAERTSPYRFAVELANHFDLPDAQRLLRRATGDWNDPQVREETSLNTARARRELKLPMPLLREGLARFAEQRETNPFARLHGALAVATHDKAA